MDYFTHLHVHTDYSLLDGAISHEALIEFAKKHELKAIGTSDHGNIFGAVKFFQTCKKAGIKPILGIETYMTEDARVKDADNRYYHLILIVQNAIGYKNLCKLISFSYQNGFYFKPRIDYKILENHCEGLIATTACLGSHINQLLLQNNDAGAIERINWFSDHFGRDHFYLEVQPEEQPEQIVVNKKLYEISAQHNIPLVVGCDAHYPTPEDYEAHEVMLAVQTHAKLSDDDRFSFGALRAYLKSPDEVKELFKDHLDAVYNTGKIADSCEFTFPTGKLFFPKFEIPAEHTPQTYFKELCIKGFQDLIANGRFPADQTVHYRERLDLEMDLIVQMGFAEYFLVVSDFIQWAHRNSIPVGPGRGSAAGALVAWSLGITNIDPIQYNLLFERFLNPERISMPDIDIDFCIEGRERVIDYVRDKYGHDKVCQIVTFGTMMAKGVIKDVARVLGMSFEDSNMITGLIPDTLKITLKDALEQEPRLKELVDNNLNVKKLFDIAFRLEGLTRHASKHAAGIVISPEPIDDVLPVYIPPKTDELVTQYDMTELEYLGFVKIDFLGLKNLTLIARALHLIKRNHGIDLDIDKIPMDDSKSFALIADGKTKGIFQLESDGLKEVLRKLKPEKFEDIIAVNALYRPGPLGSGMVDDFIERKHGRQRINYLFAELEPVLSETYGVIVYQEQVMKIASAIAGYTLGQADILRRAMGKKKVEVMAEQKNFFVEGAKKHNFDATKAAELFDLMAYFAGYGFNKSHSAAYALIAYQTAYLKANYPAEFMACLISLETSNPDAMTLYLEEAKSMGITLLPPAINESDIQFEAIDGNIRFGLHGIKNVGLAALADIVAERNKKPFTDLLDFATRIDLRTANKRVFESLICAGAFDELPGTRAQQFNEIGKIMEIAAQKKKEQLTGQISLFGGAATATTTADAVYSFAPCQEWTNKEKLDKEKEVAGFYLSEHPLAMYKQQAKWFQFQPFIMPTTIAPGSEPVLCGFGLLKNRRDIVTKKGDRMAFITLEDQTSTSAEIIVFPKLFKKVEPWLDAHQIFAVRGAIDLASTNHVKIKADELVPFELLVQEWQIKKVEITLAAGPTDEQMSALRNLLMPGRIPLDILFIEQQKQLSLAVKQTINVSIELLTAIANNNCDVRVTL